MAEGRVHLPHPINISHVPHVQTVVVVNTAEPVADRVKHHRNDIWVTGAHLGGKKVANGKEIGDFFKKKQVSCRNFGEHTLKIGKHLILRWIHSRVKSALHLSHLVLVTAATSEPSVCGLGSVQTNCRSTALKTCTVPSAPPQKMVSSDRDREWAAPAWKQDTDVTGPFHPITDDWIQQCGQQSVSMEHQQVLHGRLPKTSCTWPLPYC